MRNKSPLLILAVAALLASCGSNTTESSSKAGEGSIEATTSQTTQDSKTSDSSSEGASSSQGTTTSQDQKSSAEQSEDTSNPSGIVEEASAPVGVILTDWTDEMKTILRSHLNGYLPPFFFLDGLKVTFDELEYLSVSGYADDSTLTNYGATLYEAGWDGYIYPDQAGRNHLYGRFLEADGLLEVDALVVDNLFSANLSFTPTTADWPEGYVAMAMEEYGSTATLPALSATSYIAQISYMYEVDIFCIGVDASSLATYAEALRNARWTVTVESTEDGDIYTAVSLDALAVLNFYYDGTGIQLILNHGEGEIYDTWADCIGAIDDFATYDLRLASGISSDIPEVPSALRYTIDRSTRGRLTIQALKNTSFKMNDVIAYRELCRDAGLTIDESKSTEDEYIVWAYPADLSYALTIELGTYYSDLGDAISTFNITIQDYRIYLGYAVRDSWPEDMVSTIVNSVAPGSSVPGYLVENAIYYAKSNYSDEIVIDIVNPGEDPLNTYKTGLENYGFKVSEEDGVYTAVDRKKTVQASFSLVDDELHVVIRRYVQPLIIDGDEATLEFMATTITNNDKGWWTNVTFGSTPFYVNVDYNDGNVLVGNSGDYIQPLRLYNNQIVTIAPAEGQAITKIQLVTVDLSSPSSKYNYSKANAGTQSFDGATFESYNTNTDIATYIVDADHQSIGVQFTVNGQFILESVIVTLAA